MTKNWCVFMPHSVYVRSINQSINQPRVVD